MTGIPAGRYMSGSDRVKNATRLRCFGQTLEYLDCLDSDRHRDSEFLTVARVLATAFLPSYHVTNTGKLLLITHIEVTLARLGNGRR